LVIIEIAVGIKSAFAGYTANELISGFSMIFSRGGRFENNILRRFNIVEHAFPVMCGNI
jgi:hypothetical protein